MVRFEVVAWDARSEIARLLQSATGEGRTGWEHEHIAVDLDFFAKLDAEGALLCVVAMDGKKAVGVQMTAVGPHPLMSRIVCAQHITIYITPDYRGLGHGQALLDYVTWYLREHGVDYMYLGRTTASTAHGFFARNGFEVSDVVYSKVLR